MAKSTKQKINFESCDKPMMRSIFGIKQVEHIQEISDWIDLSVKITEEESKRLSEIHHFARYRLEDWGEETLKMNFIAPVLSLVQFSSEEYEYTPFADEKIEVEIGEYLLTGRLDWFVAKGLYKPEKPIFFIQEYKRNKGNPSDPDGQILAEMLASRQLNGNPEEVFYGIVVLGRYWSPIVFKDSIFAIGKSYDAREFNELIALFELLKGSKIIIDSKAKESL